MTDDPFVAHRSLLFTVAYEMLGSAADAEDVVQETWLRWADSATTRGRGARPARLPGADRHPAGAQPAAHARAPARGLRRRVAARAAADQPGRRRRRRARRERLDRDAHRARDARPDRAGGVRAARGVRHAVRRDRRGGRQVGGRRAADRAPGARARGRAPAADGRSAAPSSSRSSSGSWPRSPPATCRGCWTCSRPTWSLVADGGGVVPAARHPVVGRREVARLLSRFAGSRPDVEVAIAAAQRRAGGPGRPRRRARHGDQPSSSRTAGSPASTRSATRTSWAGWTRWPSCGGERGRAGARQAAASGAGTTSCSTRVSSAAVSSWSMWSSPGGC